MAFGVLTKLLPRKTWKRVALALLLVAVVAGVHLTSGHVAAAPRPSAYVAQPMVMQHSRDESAQTLYYYLIPAEPAQVQAALQSSLASEGYVWSDDSAPLNQLSAFWVNISARHHPEVRQSLFQSRDAVASPLLAEALAKGVVTPEEKVLFEAALAKQAEFADDADKQVPFFTQRIQRWRFTRTRGDTVRYDDQGGLMDVTPMLNQGPTTLVWFAGTRTERYRQFHLISCMTGVACFPAPGFEDKEDRVMYVDAELDRRLHDIALRFRAQDPANTIAALRDFVRTGTDDDAAPPLRDGTGVPGELLSAYDLPTDEANLRRYDNDGWRLLALPDGSVVAAGGQTRRYAVSGGKLTVHDEPAVFGAEGGVRIDAQGVLWGFTRQGPEDGLALVRWVPGQAAAKPIGVPYEVEDWALLPGHGIGLRESDSKLHVLDVSSGRWSDVFWDSGLRGKVSDSLEQAMPWDSGGVPIHFHDDLLWSSDRDLYGVSPLTGKVAGMARLTKRSRLMTSVFFGSRDGGWAIALTDAPSGPTVYRLFDLATGEPRADLSVTNAYYPAGVARTAHGRLLATAGGASENVPVTVFAPGSGQLLASLSPPTGYAATAVAFSWKGDGLWIYLEEAGADSHRKLAWWPVPEAYRDAAAGDAVPDQLRCDERLDACKL